MVIPCVALFHAVIKHLQVADREIRVTGRNLVDQFPAALLIDRQGVCTRKLVFPNRVQFLKGLHIGGHWVGVGVIFLSPGQLEVRIIHLNALLERILNRDGGHQQHIPLCRRVALIVRRQIGAVYREVQETGLHGVAATSFVGLGISPAGSKAQCHHQGRHKYKDSFHDDLSQPKNTFYGLSQAPMIAASLPYRRPVCNPLLQCVLGKLVLLGPTGLG